MLKRKEDTKKQQLDAKEPAPDESASQAKAKISHKKKDLLAKLQRVTADFANYQKRMAHCRVSSALRAIRF